MSLDIINLLPSRPPVMALDMPNRVLLWAMREWLAAALARAPVTARLHAGLDGFGMDSMAAPAARFMDEASNAWPEQLRLFPARCGCPISYDEWLLLGCVADAARNDRATFDRRLCEMIGASARQRLWETAIDLARVSGQPYSG